MRTSAQISQLPAQRESDTGPPSTGAHVGLMRRTVPAEALLGPLCPPPFQGEKKKEKEKKKATSVRRAFSATASA